jgi:hypothetical protein
MPVPDRLPAAELERLLAGLQMFGLSIAEGEDIGGRLNEIRHQYEPYLNALGQRFLITLPPWMARTETADSWQTSAWDKPIGDKYEI